VITRALVVLSSMRSWPALSRVTGLAALPSWLSLEMDRLLLVPVMIQSPT